MKKLLSTMLATAVVGMAGAASAVPTVITSDVTTNTTWSGEIVLDKPIFVKNNAILTILAGTTIYGQPRTAAVVPGSTVGTPGVLIVTQSGRIRAEGSASNPIIMTTAAVDNNNDGIADDDDSNGFRDAWVSGDTFLDDTPRTAPLAPLNKAGNGNVALWGGLVILGSAPTNLEDKCGVGYGQCTIEGLTVPGFPAADALYGGNLPHDSSGVLKYVSVRHAGDEIGNSNELNGLSLGGVGDGTVIENVEVYANFDDAFEWFGGTVNGKNLVAVFAGDDHFDLDEGYTGTNQFLFAVMPTFNQNAGTAFGSASGDKAGEFDGDNYRPDNIAHYDNVNVGLGIDLVQDDTQPRPLSNPAFYNVTVIGSTLNATRDFTPVSTASVNRGLQFRNGFAGNVFNSIVVNTGTHKGFEVDTSLTSGAPGYTAIDNANNGLINVVCSTFSDGAALGTGETTISTNGNSLALALGGTASSANSVNPAGFKLVNEDTTFDFTGDASGKLVSTLKSAKIDPRPFLSFPPPPIAGCPAPTGTGLNPAATYRGAFPTGTALWTNGWTALSMGGLL